MVAIGRTSHAYFFDGVSDSVIIPQSKFNSTGLSRNNVKAPLSVLSDTELQNTIGNISYADFTIEAWVIPDCGGIVAKKDGQFTLELGTVDTPGPAKFSLTMETPIGDKTIVLSSAFDATSRWDGIVYPAQEHGGIHDSYNRFDTSNYAEASGLNFKNRPLYHVVACYKEGKIELYVNTDMIASKTIPLSYRVKQKDGHIYLGGKGGEFRGAIESIHFSNSKSGNILNPDFPTLSNNSTGLYRFEEPIDVVENVYTMNAVTAASNGSTTTITIGASDAQSLIAKLTGKAYDSSSPTTDFTASPYSMGNYKVNDFYSTPGTSATLAVAHTPYNLLINAGSLNRNTFKPNQKPPERVRLHSINGSSGVITISSIHVDFVNGTNGLRGLLHSRTADVDNYFVVVGADLLIDNGTGKPYQPPHYGTQIFDKTGQMILDESNTQSHGLVYSSRMATTTTDTTNPYAVVWPSTLDELFQVGHSGRHALSHIEGHEYMRRFPIPNDMTVDQLMDGNADIVSMHYDSSQQNLKNTISINSRVDAYASNLKASVAAFVNSSSVPSIVDNGLPAAAKELIAIGGVDFDVRPFFLKGPVPNKYNDESTRLYHLRPEKESRIALLKVPVLQSSHDLAPYVEIHYNAIDLTGASMGESGPMLMVTKTVPAASFDLGSETVLQAITRDITNTVLYSAGGVIDLNFRKVGTNYVLRQSHTLIGDNTGGNESDAELDFSTTPALYTPVNDVNAVPASPPKIISKSHNSGNHESVYHKLYFTPTLNRITPDAETFYTKLTPATEKTGTGVFDIGPINSKSHIFETFDIIDNQTGYNLDRVTLYVQPTNKKRTNQLYNLTSLTRMVILQLMTKGRVRSINETVDGESNQINTEIIIRGVSEEILSQNASVIGSGSPDSHVVKEIEPNSPVVTVTLGGPGQGAVNTKPTFDPATLMRLPGSTRRICAVQAVIVTAKEGSNTNENAITVQPLNNNSPDIASWGTYCFPKKGRIYLADGASAEYVKKNGTGFVFSSGTIADRTFLSGNGTAFATFYEWALATGLLVTTAGSGATVTDDTSIYIYNEDNFSDDSLVQDGSTVNDRMFQSMNDVNHDYQLGTQYSSTRAMVEIPFFPQQFFEHETEGIFPGPDNSMKIHIDATYTAHSWNPTPVGRRADDIQTADRSANSAYTYNIHGKNFVSSSTIQQIVYDSSGKFFKIFVSHPEMFPPVDTGVTEYRNLKSLHRFRRAFIPNGMWCIYVNDPSTDGYLKVWENETATNNVNSGSYATGFFESAIPQTAIHIAQGYRSENLIPLDSDMETPSSDLEARSPYYYDNANVQTQGGNLDYGLRQYVSAIEIKEGPLSNPHAPKILSKRATSTIVKGGDGGSGTYSIILEDTENFPELVEYSRNSSNDISLVEGDMLYIGEVILSDGTSHEGMYFGKKSLTNNLDVVNWKCTTTSLTLEGATFRLKSAGRSLYTLSSPANSLTEEKTAVTFLPDSSEQWTIAVNATAGGTTSIQITPTTANRLAHANTIGMNIRKDDELYFEDASDSNAIKYLGKVSQIISKFAGSSSTNTTITLTAHNANTVTSGDKIRLSAASVMAVDFDAILNKTWINPYAQGGMRNGDTVWMNMTLNNPHAVEGLFCKSRGVLNEGLVWKGFNGGEGTLATRPRDSIPLENFLIGNTCVETAQNLVQHINKTVEMNYEAMGLNASQAPSVAYVDPYLASKGHARVLLYDVGHDREFIAFHDLHMQVQSSAATPNIGFNRNIVHLGGVNKLDKFLVSHNGGAPHYFTTQIDVANGYPSENKFLRSTQQSKFIESAYAHNIANQNQGLFSIEDFTDTSGGTLAAAGKNAFLKGKGHGHFVHSGYMNGYTADTFTVSDNALPRVEPAVASLYWANEVHSISRSMSGSEFVRSLRTHRETQDPVLKTHTFRDASTLFDTPDGTRCISAFLCLKGNRNLELDLTNHDESRLKHLPHWSQMDFVRRLVLDCGEIGVKEGVTDIEAATRELVRMINQAGAKHGRTQVHTIQQGVGDVAITGSTHDPAPWWFTDESFNSNDKGTHMGYVRAHLGRVVEDINGNEGYSIIIHSTIPGASGRNFCVWLDNSKGQASYKPLFLIGHGGRFRNFWCQPDETSGENMHPAPMPLNKHGRPFAPITSLREYTLQEEPAEPFTNNHDVARRDSDSDSRTVRNISGHIGALNHNTVSDESFEIQGVSTSYVEGLRAGKTAVGRINFGGLVASGIPGFAPDAGEYGLGVRGDRRFDFKYGEAKIPGGTAPTDITAYTGNANPQKLREDKVGESNLYGFRFTDHLGNNYGVRYIYRKFGENFSNQNTVLPSTLDDEIVVYINDDDVSMGGFTIGGHMLGYGEPSGRIDNTTLQFSKWRGNEWRGVYAPEAGVDSIVTWDGSANTLTVVLQAPFDTGATGGPLANHPDLLGYLGYPKTNGVIHLHDTFTGTSAKGFIGNVLSYESRTVNDLTGAHVFFGIRGDGFTSSHHISSGTFTDAGKVQPHASNNIFRVLMSSRINWTTLLTDEVLAYATMEAINHPNPNIEEGTTVDCRHLYACDGRTLGDWGVTEDAIIVRAFNPQRGSTPLSKMFSATMHTDFGIQAAHLEYGEYTTLKQVSSTGKHTFTASNVLNKPISDADLDKNRQVDCGYLPKTILQIRTKGKGYHANTATPVLVDSFNNAISTKAWKENLKGETFTSISGDHILPALSNPMILVDTIAHSSDTMTLVNSKITNALIPAGQEGTSVNSLAKKPSYGERIRYYFQEKQFSLLESKNGSNSLTEIIWNDLFSNEDWVSHFSTKNVSNEEHVFQRFAEQQIGGYRSYGSVDSEPLIYFKGGRDSNDHSVPLYFGGGFSGVVMDVNDGTENDYSDFYTHPYSTGPTGTAGIQNANEISTSFAIVDCNAILSFFPATALLNQHRGSINSPFFNSANRVTTDLDNGSFPVNSALPAPVKARYTAGTILQRPVPVVLRVANPNARYDPSSGDTVRAHTETHTMFAIYGPGQAFPFTEQASANSDNQPHPGYVVTTGNTWSKVPYGLNLPNDIKNTANQYSPPTLAYQNARNRFHWLYGWNWSPPQGIPNIGDAGGSGVGLLQRPDHGYHYGEHFNYFGTVHANNIADIKKAHPYKHVGAMYFSVAMGADMTFHMDGGYHPGGSWLDNQMAFNPSHPKSNYAIKRGTNIVHPTAFRVSGLMAKSILTGSADVALSEVEPELVVVDATRCQNGEELATVLGQAMNEFPGKSAIKAMGGTFAPSMGNAMRQDRYGWIELDFATYTVPEANSGDFDLTNSYVEVRATMSGGTQAILEQIPACGWLRTSEGGTTGVSGAGDIPCYAPYHSREVIYQSGAWGVVFALAPNKHSKLPVFEDVKVYEDKLAGSYAAADDIPDFSSAPSKLYVWSKAGVHRFNNENETARDHMTQVHFSGIVDAIDRTRPVGAVGWAGERYSYLNSLKVGTEGYGAGLGAWHAKLGFSPYGSSNSCMTAYGHLPHTKPIKWSPEASRLLNGVGGSTTGISTPYTWNLGLAHTDSYYTGNLTDYASRYNDGGNSGQPIHHDDNDSTTFDIIKNLHQPQGVYSRAFVVISYESEFPLIAKHDRDGITATGDWLTVVSKTNVDSVDPTDAIKFAGTVQWDERIHNSERFTAPANAGPNVEALIATSADGSPLPFAITALDSYVEGGITVAPVANDALLANAEPCFAETGDLFSDIDESPGTGDRRNLRLEYYLAASLPSDGSAGATNVTSRYAYGRDFWWGDINAYKANEYSSARNFSVENVVWKRMDGGNLSLPAVNARGLGAVPFVTRVSSNGANSYLTGEKLLGNNRFTFETTNNAMFPIIQAQEISHPQLAQLHPNRLRDILDIPNEEIQFESIEVLDDTGQVHSIEGGSPFGTIVRSFKQVSDRTAEGLAPAEAGSGVEPNLKIQLPNPDSIPGNIIIRSGFDRLQAYQTETMGTGGMLRPEIDSDIDGIFTDATDGPRLGPTFSDHEYDHISQNLSEELFPEMTRKGWKSSTNNAPLKTSYELHDRSLYFHVTKNGNSHTHRYPTTYSHANGVVNNDLTGVSFVGTTLTVNTAVNANLFVGGFGNADWVGGGLVKRYLRLHNPTTGESGVASFTNIAGSTFENCKGDANFTSMVASSITACKVVPSYYVPAGSNRFFAARRMRDHAEVSGNSPDMAHSLYLVGGGTQTPYETYKKPILTPMAVPRMGHHFVNASQVMLPGHWAHPAYQGLYGLHRAERSAFVANTEKTLINDTALDVSTIPSSTTDQITGYDPSITIGTMTATPSGPSDIHGGAFTLMFETKVKYDGYGVLASKGQAGVVNSKGGHTIVLEAAATYTLKHHFPDPSEVGAYQIVIQPNIHKSQLIGFHENGPATDVPVAGGATGSAIELTGQQVALVVGIREPDAGTGGLGLVLAEAVMADVRGCELFINELMIDHDPDHGSQFTNIPPLMSYNPLGVQSSESPAFTRRSLPYNRSMFAYATPGITSNIPWWSIVHESGPEDSSADGIRHLSIHRLDNYYEFLRASAGSIGCQLTLGGYPSNYPDLYSNVLENISLAPVCTVVSKIGSPVTVITVDDARGFPKVPHYGMKLEYTDADGVRRTHTYTERSGNDASYMNKPYRFTITASSNFTNNLTVGTKIRLTRAYDFRPAGTIFNDTRTSVITHSLLADNQAFNGSRDTNSLHMGDAYLCLWHPNLGRPHTFYSDSSRTWLNPLTDRAVLSKPLNSMPEHFETVHYHDATYYASLGPFAFNIATPTKPGTILTKAPSGASTPTAPMTVIGNGTTNAFSGTVSLTANQILSQNITGSFPALTVSDLIIIDDETFSITAMTGAHTITYTNPNGGGAQSIIAIVFTLERSAAHTTIDSNVRTGADGSTDTASQSSGAPLLNHYWPCGSRGGPLTSRLDGYGYVSASWDYPLEYTSDGPVWVDQDDDGSYVVTDGITKTSYDSISNPTRTRPYGYRFSLRQPYNKPQWALYGMRAYREASITGSNTIAGYQHGPLVQQETQSWTYGGGDSSPTGGASPTYPNTYVGVMERQTNFSGMLGVDKPEWQVRYGNGMRMTRAFGCPVRTLRNASTVVRDWWGDATGKGIDSIHSAVNYYLVDWWGNTRGEDIRRYPVRGFGIRPAWDSSDAYEYDRVSDRTPYQRLYNNGQPLVNLKTITDLADSNVTDGLKVPRFGGRLNNVNNNDANNLVDVFMPTHAQRIGDMGNGRGVRYPTAFNEDLITDVDEPYHTTGVVLSHNTAEPNTSEGLIRARNDVLQPNEVPRGISARLGIDENGLLKPEAVASDRVEDFSGETPHKDAVSRSSPRIGIDGENIEGVDDNMMAINTEAHSLHTDRNVGQRVVLQGGLTAGSQTLGNYDLTSLTFAGQPQGGVMRYTHTSNFNPLGGTYLAETRNYLSPVSDKDWGGISGSNKTANPYETNVFVSSAQTNFTDKSITFMLRTVRLLDKQHVEVFRPNNALHSSSPQYGANYFSATGGGKYGLFLYETTNGRASSGYYIRATNPDTNPPYAPAYVMNISSNESVPVSKGPKIIGISDTSFDSSLLNNEVTRLVISENTLQHYRSDAPRRRSRIDSDEKVKRMDFTVLPRFSQALHPKGHKGDVTYNTSDHTGDGS